VENLVSHYVNLINTTSKLILHNYGPFKSDLTSQQQTAALLTFIRRRAVCVVAL